MNYMETYTIFNDIPGLIAGTTYRDLGADYKKIAEAFGLKPDRVYSLKQIHSTNVVDARELASPDSRCEVIEGDALITDCAATYIGIRTADCVPLLLYAADKKCCAAIHAGWRGLVYGVIENTLAQLIKNYNVDPRYIKAAIGPCISFESFEVGPEVVSEFLKQFTDLTLIQKGTGDRSFIDLKRAAQVALISQGVKEENIEISSGCTYQDREKYYSYRGGDEEGRIFSFIGWEKSQ